jgi:hypothetical protein
MIAYCQFNDVDFHVMTQFHRSPHVISDLKQPFPKQAQMTLSFTAAEWWASVEEVQRAPKSELLWRVPCQVDLVDDEPKARPREFADCGNSVLKEALQFVLGPLRCHKVRRIAVVVIILTATSAPGRPTLLRRVFDLPLHVVSQIIEAGLADPLIAGTFRIVIAGSEALVLNVGTVKVSKFGPTCSAVIVIPIVTPPSIPTKLQLQPIEVACVIDAPLFVGGIRHVPPSFRIAQHLQH